MSMIQNSSSANLSFPVPSFGTYTTLLPEFQNVMILLAGYIAIFGIVTNLLCVLVFSCTAELRRERIFMFTNALALSEMIYSAQSSVSSFLHTSYLSYGDAFYFLFWRQYFSTALAWFNIIVELWISVERYCIIANRRNWAHKIPAPFIIAGIFVFSVLFYLPTLVSDSIVQETNSNGTWTGFYVVVKTDYGRSIAAKYVAITFFVLRGPVSVTLSALINGAMLVAFKRYMHKKKNLRAATNPSQRSVVKTDASVPKPSQAAVQESAETANGRKAGRNITRMIISLSVIFVLGNFPFIVVITLMSYLGIRTPTVILILNILAIPLLLLSHSVHLFVYLIYNKKFKQVLVKAVARTFGFLECMDDGVATNSNSNVGTSRARSNKKSEIATK